MFIFLRSASNSFCEANNYKTSLLNPSCRTGNLQRGTECIDCCKQYNCDPNDIYCNKKIIQSEHMPCTYCFSTLITDAANASNFFSFPLADFAVLSRCYPFGCSFMQCWFQICQLYRNNSFIHHLGVPHFYLY